MGCGRPLCRRDNGPSSGNPGRPTGQVCAAQVEVRPHNADFWESIRESESSANFEAYLAQFPSGAFAALARNKLEGTSKNSPFSGVVDLESG